MKILIIGSCTQTHEKKEFKEFCSDLGEKLSGKSIEILLGSPFEGSFDYELVQGILKSGNQLIKLRLYYPKSDFLEKKWYSILSEFPMESYSQFTFGGFDVENKEVRMFSWLYSQLQALEEADIVLALGGNEGGASNLFFKIAETKKKVIIPIVSFVGSARTVFDQLKYQIEDVLSEDVYNQLYRQEDREVILNTIANELANEKTFISSNKSSQEPVFFISYSRSRPAEADQIEMILRRRNYTVWRDENEIDVGDDILNAISENIAKSNIFIAVWCKEYACSPYCYDEIQEALKRRKSKKTELWVIRVEDIRIVPKKARKLLYVDAFDREAVEGKMLNLLERINKG